MTLKLHLPDKRQVIIISAYVPTMTNPDEVKKTSFALAWRLQLLLYPAKIN